MTSTPECGYSESDHECSATSTMGDEGDPVSEVFQTGLMENLDRVSYTLSMDPDEPHVMCLVMVTTSLRFRMSSPLELLYHNVQN